MTLGVLSLASAGQTWLGTVAVTVIIFLVPFLAIAAMSLLSGFSVNGRPMRFDPAAEGTRPANSWWIEGISDVGTPISCSFVEFDEHGDFIDINQYDDCRRRLHHLAKRPLWLVIYCHGWKNNSQSNDVLAFNRFLNRLAVSEAAREHRVHGVYLAWRGNMVRPYVDRSEANINHRETVRVFRGSIVDPTYHRRSSLLGIIPENLTYWNRKRTAEFEASGLSIAQCAFAYAGAAKQYGESMGNQVCAMGHSFGALMLERSLAPAIPASIQMDWWVRDSQSSSPPPSPRARSPHISSRLVGSPFDFLFFINSAAPAIYAKMMRDFLFVDRIGPNPLSSRGEDFPWIVSLTSTADWATRCMHPLANFFVRFSPSFRREYTTRIFGKLQWDGKVPSHRGIRQSEFYTTTPGHNRYLINHWIVRETEADPPLDISADAAFRTNFSVGAADFDVFLTSKTPTCPAAAWRITSESPGKPLTLDGLPLSGRESNYWIVSCGKELIADHNDIWSQAALQIYAGLYRAALYRRHTFPEERRHTSPEDADSLDWDADSLDC